VKRPQDARASSADPDLAVVPSTEARRFVLPPARPGNSLESAALTPHLARCEEQGGSNRGKGNKRDQNRCNLSVFHNG
jgi:hypothetical protein